MNCQPSWLGFRATDLKANNLPKPERERGQEHVRKAGASNAPVVCGKELAKVEDGKTLLVHPRGRGLTFWVPFKNAHPLDIGESVILGDVEIEAVKTVHGPISVPILWFRIEKQPGPGERVGIGSVGFKITLDGLNLGFVSPGAA